MGTRTYITFMYTNYTVKTVNQSNIISSVKHAGHTQRETANQNIC